MIEGYFFEEQIAKFQIQFMAVFEGLHYKSGKRESGNEVLAPVPIVYGSRDRVTASIMSDNTQNKAIRLPTMSAYMTSLDVALDRFKGSGTERRTTYLPRGGIPFRLMIPSKRRNHRRASCRKGSTQAFNLSCA